jgi:Nif-specific regulatory protein
MNAKLTIISDKLKGQTFELESEQISVGREADNDVVLKDSSVSRVHCTIQKHDNQCIINDLQSLNGTFVNEDFAENIKLNHGDKIRIGDFVFRFKTGDFVETSNEVLFDKTEFRIPNDSIKVPIEEVFGAMARDLTAILKISTKLNSIRNIEELQSELLQQIFEVIPAETGAILLVGDELEFVETVSLNKQGKSETVRVSQTVINQVIREKKVILIKDFLSDKNLHDAKSLALSEISTLVCVPITLFEKPIGVIYLSSSTSNFDESNLKFLTAIAGITAIAIENARNFAWLESENSRLRDQQFERNMIGESPAMLKVFEIIDRVSPTDSTVLINGESGTGKELAAQAIHLNSPRKEKPFVAINCAALTETLLESELFGHEKGSFTGASAQKKGKIEIAHSGTLFLDEIGEMPVKLQAKLLRVLQEREFERVGGNRPIKVDIRLIAATNRDLQTEVKNGNFRQDLYYRLNVVQFSMPTLLERKEDILLIAESFIEKFSQKMNRRVRGISASAKKILLKYDFKGNVRELENTIERAIVLGSTDWILPEDLPEEFLAIPKENEANDASNYHDAVREKKKELIISAFYEAKKSYVETAKLLDVHPNYLHRLIKNLGIKEEIEEIS